MKRFQIWAERFDMISTYKELLADMKAARDLISDHHRWCRGALAMDSSGNHLDSVKNYGACRFCGVGAWAKCSAPHPSVFTPGLQMLNDKSRAMYGLGNHLPAVNDQLGRRDVLKVFDAVIADLEEKS